MALNWKWITAAIIIAIIFPAASPAVFSSFDIVYGSEPHASLPGTSANNAG